MRRSAPCPERNGLRPPSPTRNTVSLRRAARAGTRAGWRRDPPAAKSGAGDQVDETRSARLYGVLRPRASPITSEPPPGRIAAATGSSTVRGHAWRRAAAAAAGSSSSMVTGAGAARRAAAVDDEQPAGGSERQGDRPGRLDLRLGEARAEREGRGGRSGGVEAVEHDVRRRSDAVEHPEPPRGRGLGLGGESTTSATGSRSVQPLAGRNRNGHRRQAGKRVRAGGGHAPDRGRDRQRRRGRRAAIGQQERAVGRPRERERIDRAGVVEHRRRSARGRRRGRGLVNGRALRDQRRQPRPAARSRAGQRGSARRRRSARAGAASRRRAARAARASRRGVRAGW